jgi:hypothetical protein
MHDAPSSNPRPNAKYEVTEEDFHRAVNNAGYHARRRLFKKMKKVVFGNKNVRFDRPRPPMDLEDYVTNFVLTYKDKGVVNEVPSTEPTGT